MNYMGDEFSRQESFDKEPQKFSYAKTRHQLLYNTPFTCQGYEQAKQAPENSKKTPN